METFAFGLAGPLPIKNGIAKMPEGPGLGIALDRDLIENDTLELL